MISKILITMILFSLTMVAQNNDRCSAPETKQFDFWIGNWDLSWSTQQGQEGKGSNKIERILGDCVVKENFKDLITGFEGISHSVYVPNEKVWKQTWVSNGGGYLDFVGAWEDDRMILSRSFTNPEGQEIHQRMIWYDIEEDSLEWNWEKSTDGGENWEVVWNIHYKRKDSKSN